MAKNVTDIFGEIYFTPNGKSHTKDKPITPFEEDFSDHNNLDYSYENDWLCKMRKSMSMNDIFTHREDLVKLEFEDREDVYHRHRQPWGGPETEFVSMDEGVYDYVTYGLGQQESENMEVEEIRKHEIKASRIPKSVLEGTRNFPEVQKKPITIPEPSKLTEIQKKAAQSSDGTHHQFKAGPAPRHILEKPHIPVKPPVPTKFRYTRTKSADRVSNDNLLQMKPQNKEEHHPRLGRLKPAPFAFDKRDEELKRRREERIKRLIEEERKKASSFKAQPVPRAVKKRMHCTASKGSSSAASSENKENVKFRAKPPVVLHKEPFKPIMPVHQIKLAPFKLSSEKRSAERERFKKQLQEKEEEKERQRLLKEKEQEEAEEIARAELRAKQIHHAKPVPKSGAAPFVPEKSVLPLTVPETPNFVRRLKKN